MPGFYVYVSGAQRAASGADVQHSGRKNCQWNTLNGGDTADAPRAGPFELFLDVSCDSDLQKFVDCWTLSSRLGSCLTQVTEDLHMSVS